MKKNVYLYGSGNQIAFIDAEQVPALHKPWIIMLFELFEQQGYDPCEFTWYSTDGVLLCPVKNNDGSWNWTWNWRVERCIPTV